MSAASCISRNETELQIGAASVSDELKKSEWMFTHFCIHVYI